MSADCSQNPLRLLMNLAHRLEDYFAAAAAEFGLTPAQAQLLMQLECSRRMGDLATEKTCDPSSVTTMIQRLERDGLLDRVVDPNDGRARLVTLTTAGRRLRNKLVARVGDGLTVIDELPEEERTALAALFSGSARSLSCD